MKSEIPLPVLLPPVRLLSQYYLIPSLSISRPGESIGDHGKSTQFTSSRRRVPLVAARDVTKLNQINTEHLFMILKV